MTNTMMATKKVIACIDASPYAQATCDAAIWATQKLQAPLALLHVLDKAVHHAAADLSGSIGLGSQEALLQQLADLDQQKNKLSLEKGRIMLDAAKAQAEQAGISQVEEKLRHGQLVDTLAELEENIRLVVLGKRGLSSAEAHGHMGMYLEQVIRTLHKPILITQQSFTAPKRIMLAYDGSATALKGLETLAQSPLCQGLPVHLVMAGANTAASTAQMEQAAGILRNAGFATTVAIVGGEPETVLHQYQQEQQIDLLVMGAYGHSRIRQFIVGSTTTAMISKAKCALLVLR